MNRPSMHEAKTLLDVQRLVSLGVDVDGRDNKGKTSLMVAVESGNVQLVRALIDYGADTTKVRAAKSLTPEMAWVLAWYAGN